MPISHSGSSSSVVLQKESTSLKSPSSSEIPSAPFFRDRIDRNESITWIIFNLDQKRTLGRIRKLSNDDKANLSASMETLSADLRANETDDSTTGQTSSMLSSSLSASEHKVLGSNIMAALDPVGSYSPQAYLAPPLITRPAAPLYKLTLPSDPNELATAFFDNTIDIPRMEFAPILASKKNAGALKFYMAKCDFTGLCLIDGFRKLCTKLYLAGETQQVDRILSSFSSRWYECNTANPAVTELYLTFDIAYSILFSMVLLNTDLHIANNKEKMKEREFVRNTLGLLERNIHDAGNVERKWKRSMEAHLKEIYATIKNSRILQRSLSLGDMLDGEKVPDAPAADGSCLANSSTGHTPSIASEDKQGYQRPKSTTRKRSNTLSALFSWRKDVDAQPELTASLAPVIPDESKDMDSIFNSVASNSLLHKRHRRFTTNTSALDALSTPPPFGATGQTPAVPPSSGKIIKTGILLRKHLLDRDEVRAKNRRWLKMWCSLCVEGERGVEFWMWKCDGDEINVKVSILFMNEILHFAEMDALTLCTSSFTPDNPRLYRCYMP